MNRTWLIVILAIGLAGANFTACYSETSIDSNTPSILLREMPQDLAARLAAQQAEFAGSLSGTATAETEVVRTNSTSTSSTTASEVRQAVLDLNLKKPATIKALSDKMLEVGPVALLELDGLLTSQDDGTREKAVFALRCLARKNENDSKETTQACKLITLLLRRAVFDRSTKTRDSTITGLSAIGFAGQADLVEDVLAGLTDAQTDPDQRNSSRAKDNIQTITNYVQGR